MTRAKGSICLQESQSDEIHAGLTAKRVVSPGTQVSCHSETWAPGCLKRIDYIYRGKILRHKTEGVRVVGATGSMGLGQSIVTSGSGISHGVVPLVRLVPWSVGLFHVDGPGTETHRKPRCCPYGNGNVLSSCSQTGWSLLPRGFAIKGAGTRRWKERVKRRVSDSAIALGKGHWNQRKSILKR